MNSPFWNRKCRYFIFSWKIRENVLAKYFWHFYRYFKCFGLKVPISRGCYTGTSTKMWERIPTMAGDNGFNLLLGHSVELSCGKSQQRVRSLAVFSVFYSMDSALSTHSPSVHHSFCHPFESNHDLGQKILLWSKGVQLCKENSSVLRKAQTYQVLARFWSTHSSLWQLRCSHWEFHSVSFFPVCHSEKSRKIINLTQRLIVF